MMTLCLASRAVTARKFGPPNSHVQLKRNKVNSWLFTGQIAEGEGRHREVALRSGLAFGS